jgi:hypothetical protein
MAYYDVNEYKHAPQFDEPLLALPALVNGRQVHLLVTVGDDNVSCVADADTVERALQATGVHTPPMLHLRQPVPYGRCMYADVRILL